MAFAAAMATVAASPVPLIVLTIAAVAGVLTLSTLLLPWTLTWCRYRSNDLRRRYGATWAVVTGGSSGIGLALARRLAGQGLNVVIAAVDDDLLPKAMAELSRDFPERDFRSCGVNLAAAVPTAYLAALDTTLEDINPSVIFLNAGYMVTGFFAEVDLKRWLDNTHCNATSAMVLAHYFIRRLRAHGQRGCIVFTSSPANIIPSPFSVTYGATKSFITHLASSLACEVGPEGIDVAVVHPSPTATRFYNAAHAMPTLKMFQSTAVGPDAVADVAIRGVGRSVIIDQGYYPIAFRLLMRLVDFTFLADLLVMLAPYVQDYKYLKQASASAATAAAAAAPAPAPEPAAAVAAEDGHSGDDADSAARRRHARARTPKAGRS